MYAQRARQSVNETPLHQIGAPAQNLEPPHNPNYQKNLENFERKTALEPPMNQPPYKDKRTRKTTNPEFFRKNKRAGFLQELYGSPGPAQGANHEGVMEAEVELLNFNANDLKPTTSHANMNNNTTRSKQFY